MYREEPEWDETENIYTWEESKQKRKRGYKEHKRVLKCLKKRRGLKEKEVDRSERLKKGKYRRRSEGTFHSNLHSNLSFSSFKCVLAVP